MKKQKLLFSAILLMAMALPQSVFAYDFSAVLPSGDTLYYNFISSGGVQVTSPGSSSWSGFTRPTGALTIPSTVTYGGNTYNVTSIGSRAFYFCYDVTSVSIPSSVTSIGTLAFSHCSGLTSVTIPNSVTSIGDYAFESCYGLTSVTIPNSVTSIGNYVFSGCTGLTSVTIPNSVTSIGNGAFGNCSGLTSVTIPNSVTSIGNSAFSGCTGLSSVTIPNSVTTIGTNAFLNILLIVYYGNATGAPWGALFMNRYIEDSLIYTSNSKDTLIGANPAIVIANIPNMVTTIVDGVFEGCTSLGSVTIPNSVTSMGNSVFYGCTSLGSVTIPNSVTSIGNNVFFGCTSLNSVTIPSSVTSIGFGAFGGCTSLSSVTIPSSVTSIGSSAFSNCISLSAVTIPSSVTSIGSTAFYGCTSLGTVTIPNHITTIDGYTFCNCTNLTSVTIPTSVTSIGYYAFSGCTSLDSVTIPNSVTSIGNAAFSDCTSLSSVTIPNSVTTISMNTFSGCTGLISVSLPSSLTTIGFGAFSGCYRLSPVTIPNSVTSMVFNSFDYVRMIYYYGSYGSANDTWGALCRNGYLEDSLYYTSSSKITLCGAHVDIVVPNIPNTVTKIGEDAFIFCERLLTVNIPNTVTTIEWGAFQVCTRLRSVIIGTPQTIDSTVCTLKPAVFYNDTNLQNIELWKVNPPLFNDPYGNYSNTLFYGVPSNCIVRVPCYTDSLYRASVWGNWFSNIVEDCSEPSSTYYDFWSVAPSGDTLYYIILDSNRVTVVHPFYSDTTEQAWWDGAVQPTGTLTIPANVTYNDTTYNVVRISEHAFYNCSTLTSVTIPSTVDSIGEWAFAYNTSLTTVSMGSAVTTIGYGAFYGCTNLNSLVIPDSLITIGSHAFSGCNVTSLTIPNTVTTIGSYAFSDWSGLTTITIPRSMTYIGDWAFAGCDSLTTVIFNADSCTYMGSTAAPVFDNDAQFNTLRIGNTVRYIPSNAFYGCSGIHTVNIPTSVSTIGDSAFANCSGLTSITSKRAVAPTTGVNAFNGVTDTIPIYIPCGSTSSYASAWPHFTNFVEEMDAHVWVRSADAAMGTARVTVQPTCDTPYATIVATPNAGYLFALWSDGDTLNPRTLMIDRDTALTALFVPMPDTITNHDTIVVHDTLMIHDTTVVNNYIHDTTIVHDTSYIDVYVHDTTIVHDTVIVNNYIHDTAYVHDTTIVNNYIHDTTIVNNYIHDTTYVHDTTIVNNYIHDTTIVNNYIHDTTYVHDTTIVNNYIHDTTYVNNYIYDTVTVTIPIEYYTLSLVSEQPSLGIVVGSGTYSDSTVVEIAAVAVCGNHFVQWSDGITESPRHMMVTEDMNLTASFAVDEVGITDVESSGVSVTAQGNIITVQGAAGQRVRIFDAVGRLLSTEQSVAEIQHFRIMAAGVYLVQVGNGTAQRVVVGISE